MLWTIINDISHPLKNFLFFFRNLNTDVQFVVGNLIFSTSKFYIKWRSVEHLLVKILLFLWTPLKDTLENFSKCQTGNWFRLVVSKEAFRLKFNRSIRVPWCLKLALRICNKSEEVYRIFSSYYWSTQSWLR